MSRTPDQLRMVGKMPPGQELASKEASLFRSVVKLYESKQYKKAIKAANLVLKSNAEHGETLAMKGLVINCMNDERKLEAFELVRRGLRHNMMSHVCWHVLGLLHRSHSEYDDAVKCYKQALKRMNDNQQVLRDLAGLQIQLRDISGFVETRHELLNLRPGNRNNWISFAVGHHLNANHALAVQVLDAYEQTQGDDIPANELYERGELLLYKAAVLREGGKFVKALAVLDKSQNKIQDQLGLIEQRAQLMMDLKSYSDAERLYRELIDLQPDNYRYHSALRQAVDLPVEGLSRESVTPQQRQQLRKLYEGLQSRHPKSSAAFRTPLDYEEGEAFRAAADAYVRRFVQKGIPSLFTNLKSLYADADKATALGDLFGKLLAAVEADKTLPALAGSSETEAASSEAEMWIKVYLVQHHDYLGNTGEALRLLTECIAAEPELLDLYSFKAAVLKHAGDLEGAAAAADKARKLDLSDRFLNSTAAKAQFRAGNVQEAERLAVMFTKDGNQIDSLHEMQCMWYETEAGRAWLHRKDYGQALKNLMSVKKHFTDFVEDQFDFHSYCIRKTTLRAYVAMLRMEDTIFHAESFLKAAWLAIEVFVRLADNSGEADQEDERLAAMTPDERKKYKQKQKKEATRLKKEEDAKVAAAAAAVKEKGGSNKPPTKKKEDPDPHGKALAATSDPLGEATKLLDKLKQHAGDRMETQKWAFEVYVRKARLLLALSAVKRALAVGGSADPIAHVLVVRFALAAQKPQAEQASHTVVQDFVAAQLAELLGGASLAQYQAAYQSDHAASSVRHLAAAAEATALIDPDQTNTAARSIQIGVEAAGTSSSLKHDECLAVRDLLEQTLCCLPAAESWTTFCAQRFPWSSAFGGEKRLALETTAADSLPTALLTNGVSNVKLGD